MASRWDCQRMRSLLYGPLGCNGFLERQLVVKVCQAVEHIRRTAPSSTLYQVIWLLLTCRVRELCPGNPCGVRLMGGEL
jgi:hypothetical protein